MLRLWMRNLPERALWRIVEAPADRWASGWWASPTGERCLEGHALDSEYCGVEENRGRDAAAAEVTWSYHYPAAVWERFDKLVVRCGMTEARRLCQNAALKEILARSGVSVSHAYSRLADHALAEMHAADDYDAHRDVDPALAWDRDPTPYEQVEGEYRADSGYTRW